MLAAADQINVPIEPEARIADYKSNGKSYAFSDNVKDFLPDGVNAIDDIGPPLP